MTTETQSVSNSLYVTCMQGIMVVVYIKINIQFKMINKSTMNLCRRVS